MVLKLYLHEASPSVRAVLITAASLGLDIDKKFVDLVNRAQLDPEYLKLNPQHTVPVLVDGDYVLWESHAIIPYLVSKYSINNSLYPKDLQKRGTVDSLLHFNNSKLLSVILGISKHIFHRGEHSIPQELLKDAEEAFAILNTLLERSVFAAGDEVTVADFCLIASVTTLDFYVPIDKEKYPKMATWVEKIKMLPCYRVNEPGLELYKKMAKERLRK